MNEDAIDLLQSVFQLNISNRPCLEEMMKHPWVTNHDVATKEEFLQFLNRR
eukprot:CAMPEP_0118702336 /NCGR_PEP_ID=MMETSP0800-20121206/17828_1 /TAXON_ID=210618 ORGANISM="Striatella unipunctata, Strain CCMP2910" /NCGR_SAMPLE_ID=MMETSP0800 /ASSEMBLY_ACC=CAM_ASM_000638 /LENGTH=50 /DNA_ID=CAMNT_0006603513 /DNA_START=37 /DNA_END=189 /DNA_ORIENTATION=-